MTSEELSADQLRKVALFVKLGALLFGAVMGAMIGGLILSGFVGAAVGNIAHLSWYCALAGGLVGGFSTYRKAAAHIKRQEQLSEVADDLGLEFSAGGKSEADRELKVHLQEMLAPDGRTSVGNILRKQVGDAVLVVTDVSQISRSSQGSSSNTNTTVSTVAYFESPDLRWPTFTMQPEGMLRGLFAGIAGLQDIDFDHYPVFSGKYLLSGQDPDAVRALFTTALLDYFTEHHGLEVRASENRLVLRAKRRCDAEHLEAFIQQAMEIFGLLMDAAVSSE